MAPAGAVRRVVVPTVPQGGGTPVASAVARGDVMAIDSSAIKSHSNRPDNPDLAMPGRYRPTRLYDSPRSASIRRVRSGTSRVRVTHTTS